MISTCVLNTFPRCQLGEGRLPELGGAQSFGVPLLGSPRPFSVSTVVYLTLQTRAALRGNSLVPTPQTMEGRL